VRPFNARETARNAKNVVEMVGKSTKITNPEVGICPIEFIDKCRVLN
jgi:hypothetical protein